MEKTNVKRKIAEKLKEKAAIIVEFVELQEEVRKLKAEVDDLERVHKFSEVEDKIQPVDTFDTLLETELQKVQALYQEYKYFVEAQEIQRNLKMKEYEEQTKNSREKLHTVIQKKHQELHSIKEAITAEELRFKTYLEPKLASLQSQSLDIKSQNSVYEEEFNAVKQRIHLERSEYEALLKANPL